MPAMPIKFAARRRGMESEDRAREGGGGQQGNNPAVPGVAPPVSAEAPSSNSAVVQVQSCLSRRQVTPAVPGCGGRFDDA